MSATPAVLAHALLVAVVAITANASDLSAPADLHDGLPFLLSSSIQRKAVLGQRLGGHRTA